MDHATLQDRLSRGMGAAARVFGAEYDLHRPEGPGNPVRLGTRVLRLHAAFDGGDPGYRRPPGFERGLRGTFDAAYVRAGDYLVGPRGTLFVAALPPLGRPLCVLCNGVLDLVRPGGPGVPGLNGYGGAGPDLPVLRGWPALLLPAGALLPAGPAEVRVGDWLHAPGLRMRVERAERSEFGWRIAAVRVGG